MDTEINSPSQSSASCRRVSSTHTESTDFVSGRMIVVTGAAGFIGSNLVDTLVSAGAKVTAIDLLQSNTVSNLNNSRNAIAVCQIDVRDRPALASAVRGADVVFHLAGTASVGNSFRSPDVEFDTNVLGTYHLLRHMHDGLFKRMVFMSTGAVYGLPRTAQVNETHLLEPISPYGASKLAGERLGAGFANAYGLEFVAARMYPVFGPRQRRHVMFDLLNRLHGDPYSLRVLGDGRQIRDFCYVDDAVQALLLLAERGQSGEAYNVAGNNPTRISDLVSILIQQMGLRDVHVEYTGQSWPGDIPVMVPDLSKIQALGYVPRITVEEGVSRLIKWMSNEIWK